ncbi:hypothetical protein MBH78_18735 [Oceanimonas sp. NS1]|nr:hypothetical protein [Oceanimonas sp. NS1]
MSCAPINPRFTTGLTLTLWYLVLMTLVTGGLLLAGDHLLGKRLLDKDRQLVTTLLDNYQRVAPTPAPTSCYTCWSGIGSFAAEPLPGALQRSSATIAVQRRPRPAGQGRRPARRRQLAPGPPA